MSRESKQHPLQVTAIRRCNLWKSRRAWIATVEVTLADDRRCRAVLHSRRKRDLQGKGLQAHVGWYYCAVDAYGQKDMLCPAVPFNAEPVQEVINAEENTPQAREIRP